MKTLLTFCFIIPILVYSQSYEEEIIQSRKEKSEHLIQEEGSILDEEEKKHFKGLDFFNVDSTYKIITVFTKDIGRKFEMPTSTDRTPIYRRYGYVTFSLNGKTCKLEVYQNMRLKKQKETKDYLFIPFRDLTSGKESYGGGRYMDVRIPNDNILELDFNYCYNPYCAYSVRYSCPIPPIVNTLDIHIRAGEKIPLGH